MSRGVPPHSMFMLQRPSGNFGLSRTCLLNSSTGDKTLAAACVVSGMEDNVVVTYDLQTQQIKNLFLGHMFSIQDIAPAPEAWAGAQDLFATCAQSGDVKIWDVRSRTGAAVVTLTGGEEPLQAVALAANRGSGSGSTGTESAGVRTSRPAAVTSSSNQLGAGMLCFAGGVGKCVWAWDLRNGSAQSLYQLSTGNLKVEALTWHEGTSSLIASCENIYQNRWAAWLVCRTSGCMCF